MKNKQLQFGLTAIPFLLAGASFFSINGDSGEGIYWVMGFLFSAITIASIVNIVKNTNS